jgi:transposase-like protein
MPYVKHSQAFKSEAVALAAVLGLSAAADQLGIEEKTLASWMAKAGKRPADAIQPASWQRVADLALTKAERLVAEGKLSAAQLLNVVTMAQKGAQSETRNGTGEPLAIDARETFWDWLLDRVTAEPMPVVDDASLDAHLEALAAALDDVRPELLRRANAEPGQPHRDALLAWASGRTEWKGSPIVAGDLLDWAQVQVKDIIVTHGSLLAWHRWTQAIDARDKVIRDRADVLATSGGLRIHEALAFAAEHLADDLPIPQPGAFR